MLMPYSAKPSPMFQFRHCEAVNAQQRNVQPQSREYTFGVEAEIDGGRDRDTLVQELDALDLPLYQKLDSSLLCGLEIISHPGSLAWHSYQMRWAEVFRLCRKKGYDADGTHTCGLHIHVGRAALGATETVRRETAAKLVLMTYSLWHDLVRFTRRTANELDDWAARPRLVELAGHLYGNTRLHQIPEEDLVSVALYAGGQDRDHSARYTAVNLTNASTVEFRIFKGTLKRDTLIASMQLVSCMIDWARCHTPQECLDTSWEALFGNGYRYRELEAYCLAHGLPGTQGVA